MLASIVCTVFVTVLVSALLTRIGPLDMPRERGLNPWPTATSGGLAVMAGVSAGVLTLFAMSLPSPPPAPVAWLLGGAALVGLIGAADDVLDLPAGLKLGLQLAICGTFAVFAGGLTSVPLGFDQAIPVGVIGGAIGLTLWMLVALNAYNFMDGADGLAVGAQAVGLFALGLANPTWPVLGVLLLVGAVANLCFLPFNHPGRRLFQGDAGALFSGFLIAGASPLLAQAPTQDTVLYVPVFAAAPLIVDVLLTLLARARARKRLAEPHREHLYQRWLIATGRPSGEVAAPVWALTGFCAALGVAVDRFAPEWTLVLLGLVLTGLAAGWFRLGRRLAATPVG